MITTTKEEIRKAVMEALEEEQVEDGDSGYMLIEEAFFPSDQLPIVSLRRWGVKGE